MSAGRLSARLLAVAQLIPPCAVLADIGCDHAYIPIEAVSTGVASRAIAADVREGPLAIAAENIRAAGLSDRICTLRSDGLDAVPPGEADVIVIAGMGGGLIERILHDGRDVIDGADALVLAPQSDAWRVRGQITSLRTSRGGFRIDAEDMVCEDGHFYPVIRAVRTDAPEAIAESPALYFGPVLLGARHPVLLDYLLRRRDQLCAISERVTARHAQDMSCRVTGRLDEIRKEQWLVEAALHTYESQ